jgi:hypothetical protein
VHDTVIYNTVLEDTYVRVDPSTGGAEGYVMFDIGSKADKVQIKNTLWHQFGNDGASNQVLVPIQREQSYPSAGRPLLRAYDNTYIWMHACDAYHMYVCM